MVKDRLDKKGTTYKLILIDSATIVHSGLKEATIMKTHLLESLETPLEMPVFICITDLSSSSSKEEIMSKGFDKLQQTPIYKATIASMLIQAKIISA